MSDNNEDGIEKILNEYRSTIDPQSFFEKFDRKTGSGISLSYAQHGLDWLEGFVRLSLPEVIIHPPMFASGNYGNFFYEFDNWRSFYEMDSLKSFQGVLVESKRLYASCIRLSNRASMNGWYGKKYKGNKVSILCIDNLLLLLATSSFYELIVNRFTDDQDSVNYLAYLWKEKLSKNRSIDNSLSNSLKIDIEAFTKARSSFIEDSISLKNYPWPEQSRYVLTEYLNKKESDNEFENQIFRYCQSVVIHFLMGHEFGHYCFHDGSEKYFTYLHNLTKEIQKDIKVPEDLYEEVFCDIVAMENCIFQLNYFSIPQTISIYGPCWLIHFLSAFTLFFENDKQSCDKTNEEFKLRSSALIYYWKKRYGLNKHPIFEEISIKANEVLPTLARSFCEIMSIYI